MHRGSAAAGPACPLPVRTVLPRRCTGAVGPTRTSVGGSTLSLTPSSCGVLFCGWRMEWGLEQPERALTPLTQARAAPQTQLRGKKGDLQKLQMVCLPSHPP